MRMHTLLHERHLLQAVQRGVITQAQAESLINLARSEEGGAARMPDTAWLSIAQAVVAGAVVGGVCIANVDHPWRSSGYEEMARALGAMVVFLAVGLGLRRTRVADAPAAVLLAGAVLQLVGVAHGLARLDTPYAYANGGMFWGFATLLVAALVMWRFMRVGPALAVASLGVFGVSIELGKELLGLHGHLRDAVALGLPGLVLMAVAAKMDRAPRRPPVDGAFWLSVCGAMAVSLGGVMAIDREAVLALPALILALVVGAEAVRQRRRVLLAGVGVVLFALPPFAASEARAGDGGVALALLFGALLVGVGAHVTRRALLARAAAGAAEDDRSIWC